MKKLKIKNCAECKHIFTLGDPVHYAECMEYLRKKYKKLVIKDIRSIPKECPLEDYSR